MKKNQDHKFDELIRQRMQNLRSDTNGPDWSIFEEQLDAAEDIEAGPAGADARDVDEVVFNKMHQYTVPFEPSHWKRMEGLLNQWFTWPQYVLRYKSMELALFLLLFFAFWQQLPLKNASSPVALQSRPVQVEAGQAGKSSNQKNRPTPQGRETQEATSGRTSLKDTSLRAAAGNKQAAKAAGEARQAALAGASGAPSGNIPGLAALPPLAHRAIRPLPSMPARLIRPAYNSQSFSAESIAALPPLLAKAPSPLPEQATGLGETAVVPSKRDPALIVGMFSSAEYNHIVVPASAEKRLSESFERAALGYGGGLSLSMDFGRLELETGAIYAARHYPVGIVYVRGGLLSGGLRGDELKTTELNILNIPLHLRFDYLHRGKWRAYVLGGGAAQVAFQTNYYTADAPQYDFMPALPAPNPEDEGNRENEIDRIRRDGVGWFEGGTFRDNAYLTLNLGFGAERYFSDRWSLFVQPVYQHSIHYFKNTDGLGPNNDRINSLSVLFGTRVRLK